MYARDIAEYPGRNHRYMPVLLLAAWSASAAGGNASDTAAVTELEPMVITDQRVETADPTAEPTITSGIDIRAGVRTTPLEELSQQSADVYVSSRGAGLHGVASGASGGIHIRGLGGSPNSQILVVEDGVPDYQGIFGHPIPDAFIPALIERVELVPGGDGVLYGTNAMGGVILVTNRWPTADRPRLISETSYGSFNTFRERVSLEACRGMVSVVGAGSAFTTDGHRAGADGRSAAGQLGIRFDPSSPWSVSLREKIVHLRGGDPGPVTHPTTDHWFEVTRNTVSLTAERELAAGALAASAWGTVGVHRLYDGFYSRDYTAGTNVDADLALLPLLTVRTGVHVDYVDGRVENRIDQEFQPVEPTQSAAVYAQATLHPSRGPSVVGGVRAHYSNPYGFVPLYKAGLRWELFDHLTLHTRLTRNFRQPTLRELYLPFPTANPDLEPEYSLNWDGGVGLRLWKVRLACTPYRTWATNLIKYFGQWPTADVVNIDQIDIWGIDLEAHLDSLGPVSVDIGYCHQDVGRYTKQNPDNKLNTTVRAHHAFEHWQVHGMVGAEWVGGLYMNNYSRDPISDVFFVDAGLGVSLKTRRGVGLDPSVKVRNMLDRKYEYIEGYRMPGIHVLATLAMEF